MKILFTFGGMPHYLKALLNEIHSKIEYEISVILPSDSTSTIGKGVKTLSEEFSFPVIKLKECKSFFGKAYFEGFLDTLKKEKPDIIVIGWPYILPLSLHFKTLRYIKNKKIGLIFREIPFMVPPCNKAISYYKKNPVVNEDLVNENPKGVKFYMWAIALKAIRLWYYSQVDATLAYALSANEIHQSYGLKKEQIFVSCNSPDTDSLFEQRKNILSDGLKYDYNSKRLLHVGRLVKWKKVDQLIQAFSKVSRKYPESELWIVGSGPEQNNLKSLVIKLEIIEKVKFINGIYDPRELSEYFMASGVYVLAGMGGLSINEAMALGKPVICSRCDGTEKQLVQHKYNGLYFKEDDSESLLESILYLFDNPEEIKRMGDNSLKIIREEINLHTVTKKFFEAFNYVWLKKQKIT